MDIGKLFNGIAVIVDNEIENKTSAIYKIKELIEAKNIPVAVYSETSFLKIFALQLKKNWYLVQSSTFL